MQFDHRLYSVSVSVEYVAASRYLAFINTTGGGGGGGGGMGGELGGGDGGGGIGGGGSAQWFSGPCWPQRQFENCSQNRRGLWWCPGGSSPLPFVQRTSFCIALCETVLDVKASLALPCNWVASAVV